MKIFQTLFLTVFISSGVNVFGMEKVAPSISEAFQYLNIACKINFSDSNKKTVYQLFNVFKCKNIDDTEVESIVANLNEEDNSNKIVCMTLFLFAYDCSENLAKEFLARKNLRNFIFKTLASDLSDAYQILYKVIEVSVDVGLFLLLEEFINQILLKKGKGDKALSGITDFVADCRFLFKNVLDKMKSGYETLALAIKQLPELFDQDDCIKSEDEACEEYTRNDQ